MSPCYQWLMRAKILQEAHGVGVGEDITSGLGLSVSSLMSYVTQGDQPETLHPVLFRVPSRLSGLK